MKINAVRFTVALLSGCAVAPLASAQNFAVLNKEANYVQTGPTTITPNPDRPFRFVAEVEGTAANPAPPNSVALPNNAGTRTLVFSGEEWRFEQTFSTQAALTAAYPNGTYQFTIGGRTASVPFTGDLFPAAPILTITGGTFSNGVLVVERTAPLTITATYPAGFVAGSSHVGVSVQSRSMPPGTPQLDLDASNEGTGFTANQVTLTVPAGSFVSGATYEIESEANRLASSFDATSVPGFVVLSAYSATLRIAVNVAGPPAFAIQPRPQTVATGSTVVFNAAANGATAYQWRRDGVNITGAMHATLVLSGSNVVAGDYSVVASNPTGNATSSNARLTVSSTTNFGRLINLSILTSIAAPGDSFTLGYVVGGAGTTGAKPLVIRAAAPSLAALGVGGTLNDPRIELFAGATKTGENDNWGGSTAVAAAFSSVGAFPYTSPTSLDAAATADITTRDNSVKVSASGNGTGLVIAEVYDATPQGGITATTPRLLNVSVLKSIDPGDSMTAGFVLRGQTSRTVLIRAIGPGLNDVFGIPGAMTDPQLTLFGAGGLRLAENDNWGGDPAIVGAAASVGAFALANAGSRDAILLRTLPPGDYTAEVRGVGGATGSVIVEVYEVP